MNKKIRVLSPITILIVMMLDIAVISYAVFAINKIIESQTKINIVFLIIEIISIIISVLVTKEVFSHYIIFTEKAFIITALDSDNEFDYSSISKIDYYKDDAISFTKNFNLRHALLYLTFVDKTEKTIDFGLITKRTFNKIIQEIENNTKLKSNEIKSDSSKN